MAVVIDGTTFSDNCDMSAAGTKWAIDHSITARLYRKIYIDDIGVAGVLTKRGDFSVRPFTVTTMWYHTNRDTLETNMATFVNGISDKSFTVNINTLSNDNCELVNEETKWEVPKPVINSSGSGTVRGYLAVLHFSFICKSLPTA